MAERPKKPCATDASAEIDEQLKPERIESVQVEQMVGGNEASLRAILQQAIVGVAQTDLSGRFVRCNEYYCRMLGYTEQELLRLRMQDVIHPEDLPTNLAQCDQLVAETRYRRKDGSELWVCNQVNAIRDAEGNPRSAVVISLDVTEHKRTEQALRKSEERLMKVLQTETVGVLFFDGTGTIIDANETFLNRMGYTRSDVEARQLTWQKLTPPEWMEASYEQMKQFEATGRIGPYEKEYFRKDGSRWWFVFAGASLGDGTIVEFCIDVSARKEGEQALRESEERFRTMAAVLELAPVLVRDMESRIVLWTQGAERLYGFSKEEALGRISHDLFQTEFPEGKAHVDERLGSVGKWEGELVHRKRDGEQLVVASQQIVYFDSSARPARILEVNADITEQKKAEAALNRSAEQLRAFAAGLQQAREEEALRIARELHDQLGRCLTAIKMDVDGIQRELSRNGLVDRSVQPLFARAQRTSQTVSEMVHTVDRISAELRPPILDDLGLAAAIEWQAKDFEARSGVACVVRLPEEDPRLSREQATALFRIFQESLTNVARHARATKVWVYLGEEAGAVALEVEDNGVGISLAQLAKYRSLGLLGMRERAAALGGKVELTGAPGQGTTVVVRIPVLGACDGENSDS